MIKKLENLEEIKRRLSDDGDLREAFDGEGEDVHGCDPDEWNAYAEDDLLGFYQVACEFLLKDLHDFDMILDHLTTTYDHFSGGRITKPNTFPGEVFAVADELETERFAAETEGLDKEIQRLETENAKLKGEGATSIVGKGFHLGAMKTIGDQLAQVKTAAWALSTWAASINWDGSGHPAAWLEGLRERIEKVQELTSGPGMKIEDGAVDRQLRGAQGEVIAEDEAEQVPPDVAAALVDLTDPPTPGRWVHEVFDVSMKETGSQFPNALEAGADPVELGRAIHAAAGAALQDGEGAAKLGRFSIGVDHAARDGVDTVAILKIHEDGKIELVDTGRGLWRFGAFERFGR